MLVCQVSLEESVVGFGAPFRGSSASPASSISLSEPLPLGLMVGPTTTRLSPYLAIATASSDVDGKSIATVNLWNVTVHWMGLKNGSRSRI